MITHPTWGCTQTLQQTQQPEPGPEKKQFTKDSSKSKEYEIFCRVKAGLKDIILGAVDSDYVLGIEDEILRFLNQMPKQIIAHLCNQGEQLDFADKKKLIKERDLEWDGSEVPQMYFNRVTKAMEQLQRAGIASDLNKKGTWRCST